MTGSFARLDQSFCGCDDSIATVGPLIPVDIALQRGLALAAAVEGVEHLPLEQAVGRVLAGPAHARGPMPVARHEFLQCVTRIFAADGFFESGALTAR